MADSSTGLVANVGAEEEPATAPHPAALAVGRLLALSLPAGGALLGDEEVLPVSALWPESLGPPAAQAAFPWLGDAPAVAWLVTTEAEALARRHGRALAGPSPEVVRQVHDKGFSQQVCASERLAPRPLRGLDLVLDPAALEHADAAVRTLQQHVDRWPDWARRGVALKPRLGSSGRGRVPVAGCHLDVESVRRALPRLARRGGAVLEPWLERDCDVSAQLHVARDGAVTLLATFEQLMSRSGVYRGHRGVVDHRGRITSGTRWDDGLLEAALVLASAAHRVGYFGPCGVDGFSFQGPDGILLRPAVELNARFTAGTMVAGLIRRALPRAGPRIGLAPGASRSFHFALDAPETGWPESVPGELEQIPLWRDSTGPRPALVFARDAETLSACIPG